MANDFIKVTTDSHKWAQRVVILADTARDFIARLEELVGISAHMNDGADYATVEAEFGIPTGKGADLVFALQSLYDKLNTDGQITGMKSTFEFLTKRLG